MCPLYSRHVSALILGHHRVNLQIIKRKHYSYDGSVVSNSMFLSKLNLWEVKLDIKVYNKWRFFVVVYSYCYLILLLSSRRFYRQVRYRRNPYTYKKTANIHPRKTFICYIPWYLILLLTSRRFYRQVTYRNNPYIRRLRIYIHEKPSFVIYLDI
jgi:hypothetical protein